MHLRLLHLYDLAFGNANCDMSLVAVYFNHSAMLLGTIATVGLLKLQVGDLSRCYVQICKMLWIRGDLNLCCTSSTQLELTLIASHDSSIWEIAWRWNHRAIAVQQILPIMYDALFLWPMLICRRTIEFLVDGLVSANLQRDFFSSFRQCKYCIYHSYPQI